MEYITIITVCVILVSVINLYFWRKGESHAENKIELEQKTETLQEVEKKRKRDTKLKRDFTLRDRLRKLYSSDKN